MEYLSPYKCAQKAYKNDKTLWYTTLEYTLPLFDTNRQKGQGEKRARDEGMNKENDA